MYFKIRKKRVSLLNESDDDDGDPDCCEEVPRKRHRVSTCSKDELYSDFDQNINDSRGLFYENSENVFEWFNEDDVFFAAFK